MELGSIPIGRHFILCVRHATLFEKFEKGNRMAGQVEPHIVANIWQQAAEKVASLRQEDPEDPGGTWHEAIGRAEALLRKEADDVLFMARMAHLLIVGNIVADDDKPRSRIVDGQLRHSRS